MGTVDNGLSRDGDGRLQLTGAAMLPPMNAEPATGTGTNGSPTKGRGTDRRRTADRFGVLNAFVDCSLVGLSRAELATWLCLYRDTRNGTASTGQADIARRAGLSVRAVQKAIGRLCERGLLVVVYRGGLNRGPSRYRVESLTNRGS